MKRAKENCLAQDYERHANVHRVAHIAMQAANNEEFGRSDRSRSAQAANRELPRTEKINARPNAGHKCTCNGKDIGRRQEETADQVTRYSYGHCARHDEGEQ